MALKDDLVGVWCESANPWDDQHTNALTLTDRNTVGTASGKVGTAGDFERSNSESLDRADETLLSMGDIDFSISVWVNFESFAGYMFIVAKDNGTTQREYVIYYDITASLNRVKFAVFDASGSIKELTFDTALSTGTWYHFVAIHDSVNNELRGYLNNSAVTPVSHTTGVKDGTASFYIADYGGASNVYVDGLINQVALWKRAITSTEVSELYNSSSGLAFADWDAGGGAVVKPRSLLTLGCGC